MRTKLVIAIGVAAASSATPAFAHPRLLTATPAANAIVAPTGKVQLVLSKR